MARGRTAMDLTEKIEHAKTAEASDSQTAFATWLKTATGVEIDLRTLIVSQKLYTEYTKTPEFEAANAERKARSAELAKAKETRELDTFAKKAAKLGFLVTFNDDGTPSLVPMTDEQKAEQAKADAVEAKATKGKAVSETDAE